MNKSNSITRKNTSVNISRLLKAVYSVILQPFYEVVRGWQLGVVPWQYCLLISCIFQLAFVFKLDFLIFQRLGVDQLYPFNLYIRIPYALLFILSGFWCWGIAQVFLKRKLIEQLTTVFTDAGLKSASGRIPSFIFDKPIDLETRHLRLKKNGASLSKWKEVEETLSSDLQIYIDHFEENRASGTIDIYYAHRPLQNIYEFPGIDFLGKDEFHVGTTRSEGMTISFADCSHFLIGGQTDFGKSHFLNQAITTLYLNNKDYTFELIDLKYGSEFGLLFPDLERVNISESASQAGHTLNKIATKVIEERAKFLKFNKCQNIGDLQKLPTKDIKVPANSKIKKKFGRMVIVVDEAFDLFLSNTKMEASEASRAKQNMIKIAAQGRFVGVHVMLGTQRPDGKAIDPLIKANLIGKICFPAANNASSMTILDNGRGAQLPPIKGRCIWKLGSEMVEVQAPFLPKEKITEMLAPYRSEEFSVSDSHEVNKIEKEETQNNVFEGELDSGSILRVKREEQQ